jgi:hypothetical protein
VFSAIAFVVVSLTALAFEQLVSWSRLGAGPKLAVLGAAVLVVASWLPLVMRQNDAAGL